LGVALWAFVYAGGLHATLAGVVLALFIPTRPPADLAVLMTQASTIIASEARHEGEVLRHGPSTPALHALDAIYDRLESPADRLLRHAGARSSYAIFALANAGVMINPGVFVGHGWLMAAIVAGLTIGKPVGVFLAAAAAVHVAAVGRGGSPRWHRLHDVALHRRAGVSKRHRLLGRQDRRVRRVDSFGRRRDCSALGGFAPGAF
jgi:NhaA family Na+:H+ antiporter